MQGSTCFCKESFIVTQPCPWHIVYGCFQAVMMRWLVAREPVWLTEPKCFPIWPFVESLLTSDQECRRCSIPCRCVHLVVALQDSLELWTSVQQWIVCLLCQYHTSVLLPCCQLLCTHNRFLIQRWIGLIFLKTFKIAPVLHTWSNKHAQN